MGRTRDSKGLFVGSGVKRSGAKGAAIVDVDKGYRKWVRFFRTNVKGPHVRTGVQGTEASALHSFGMSTAAIAAVHEFGSKDGKIPQRSFIRGTINRNEKLIMRMLRRGARRAGSGGDIERELGLVGERSRAEMVRTIDNTIGLAPLSSKTIERKGSTTPLIDIGQLKASITWKVDLS